MLARGSGGQGPAGADGVADSTMRWRRTVAAGGGSMRPRKRARQAETSGDEATDETLPHFYSSTTADEDSD